MQGEGATGGVLGEETPGREKGWRKGWDGGLPALMLEPEGPLRRTAFSP